jgi:hypothetical protein
VKATQAYRSALDPAPARERALGKSRERHAAERKWHSGAEPRKLRNPGEEGRPRAGLAGPEPEMRLPGGAP